MDLEALREQFPAFDRVAYLNTGSVGPAPRAAVEATERDLALQLADGRAGMAYFDHALAQAERLRAKVAGLMGCDPWEVALTGATTDGVNAVLAGLDLQPGDEVLTSDEEHPGLLAPLALARGARHRDPRCAVCRAGGCGERAHAADRLLARLVDQRSRGGRRRARPP